MEEQKAVAYANEPDTILSEDISPDQTKGDQVEEQQPKPVEQIDSKPDGLPQDATVKELASTGKSLVTSSAPVSEEEKVVGINTEAPTPSDSAAATPPPAEKPIQSKTEVVPQQDVTSNASTVESSQSVVGNATEVPSDQSDLSPVKSDSVTPSPFPVTSIADVPGSIEVGSGSVPADVQQGDSFRAPQIESPVPQQDVSSNTSQVESAAPVTSPGSAPAEVQQGDSLRDSQNESPPGESPQISEEDFAAAVEEWHQMSRGEVSDTPGEDRKLEVPENAPLEVVFREFAERQTDRLLENLQQSMEQRLLQYQTQVEARVQDAISDAMDQADRRFQL